MHLEDTSHLFHDCEFTKRIWTCSSLGIQPQSATYIPIGDWIRNFLKLFWKEDGVKSEIAQEFILTLWSIWIFRNNIVFRNQHENPITIYQRKEALLCEYAGSKKLKEADLRTSLTKTKDQTKTFRHSDNLHCDSACIILVDGA